MMDRRRWLLAIVFLWSAQATVAAQPPDSSVDGRPTKLSVATRHVPPFAIRQDDGQWDGIAIRLLQAIVADHTQQTGEVVEIDYREMALGDMLDATAAGEVDMAVAALTVSLEREKVLDFSHPFHRSGLGIAVSAEHSSGWFAVLDRILSTRFLKLLGGLAAMLVVSGALVYGFERKANPEQFGGGFWRGLGAGVWWSIVTLTTVGYGDKAPATIGGRVIAVLWMFVSLLTISAFTAAMTTTLTLGELEAKVSGPDDLPSVRVATVADSTSADFLRRRGIRHRSFVELPEALAELDSGRVDAVVYDAPILRYRVFESHPKLHVLPLTFQQQDYSIALPEESELRETINQAIVREINSPEWEDLLRGYLGEL